MNNIQLAVVLLISAIVCFLIIFYLYKDYLYKKQFIKANNNNLDNTDLDTESSELMNQDSNVNDVVFNIINEDYFSFVDPELDLVVDIVFFKNYKLKFLPNISTYQHKFTYYVCIGDSWTEVAHSNGYNNVRAIRLVVSLIHKGDVLTEHRSLRIVQELEACFLDKAYFRHNQFENNIDLLNNKVKLYSNVEQYLQLMIITREFLNYQSLASFAERHGIQEVNGKLVMLHEGRKLFEILDENCKPIGPGFNSNLISIIMPLHLQVNPLESFNKVVDFAADFNNFIASRLMISPKQVMNDQFYNSISRNLQRYMDSCKKKNIEIGSPIIARMFDNDTPE